MAVLKHLLLALGVIGGFASQGDHHLIVFSAQLLRLNEFFEFPPPGRSPTRLGVAENFFSGTQRFDLVFISDGGSLGGCPPSMTPCGRISTIDLSSLTGLAPEGTPHIVGEVPLPGPVFSLQILPSAKLAFAEVRGQGLAIVDLSHLDGVLLSGNVAPSLVDANQDGRDDRLLKIVPKTDIFAGQIAVDGGRGVAYVNGAQSGVELIQIAPPGRLFVDDYDPEFADLALRPRDYYPDLGKKRIRVRAINADGSEGEGDVMAQVTAPVTNVSIDHSAVLDHGLAEFQLDGAQITPAAGPITLKFSWQDDQGVAQTYQATFATKNNSNTNLQEVLDGRGVFIATSQSGADYDGITPRPNVPIAAGYDPTPRPRNRAPLLEQKVDSVQEMLNQVVGRKLSAWSNGFHFILEHGAFIKKGEVEDTLRLFKSEFNVAVNTTLETRSDIFRKLMKDYGIAESAQNARFHQILDRDILVMKEMHIAAVGPNCSGCDVAINTVSGGDTGLYELYQNVVLRFIADMITLGEMYRDGSNPANASHRWVSRNIGMPNPPTK